MCIGGYDSNTVMKKNKFVLCCNLGPHHTEKKNSTAGNKESDNAVAARVSMMEGASVGGVDSRPPAILMS